MLKHLRNLALIFVVLGAGVLWYASRPDEAQVPMDQMVGPKPIIGTPRAQTIPTVKVAEVDRWKDNEQPIAAAGLKVERFAGGLDHPRNMYMLPNGDILVAETNAPKGKGGGGIKGMFAGKILDKAGAGVPSANRIILLRDTDGDGKADYKSTLVKDLNSPLWHGVD